MINLEQTLDTVSQLPPDRQEMLIEIIQKPPCRNTVVKKLQSRQKTAITAFDRGGLKPHSFDAIIAELKETLEED